ncbi:MAG: hypothetical protein WDN02_11000 [Methylovirgula sp.]|uniref:hypothetical protein n=1 Tax=Methylovirgula sp. TaxID=1978224 RepID=UPI003075F102
MAGILYIAESAKLHERLRKTATLGVGDKVFKVGVAGKDAITCHERFRLTGNGQPKFSWPFGSDDWCPVHCTFRYTELPRDGLRSLFEDFEIEVHKKLQSVAESYGYRFREVYFSNFQIVGPRTSGRSVKVSEALPELAIGSSYRAESEVHVVRCGDEEHFSNGIRGLCARYLAGEKDLTGSSIPPDQILAWITMFANTFVQYLADNTIPFKCGGAGITDAWRGGNGRCGFADDSPRAEEAT